MLYKTNLLTCAHEYTLRLVPQQRIFVVNRVGISGMKKEITKFKIEH